MTEVIELVRVHNEALKQHNEYINYSLDELSDLKKVMLSMAETIKVLSDEVMELKR